MIKLMTVSLPYLKKVLFVLLTLLLLLSISVLITTWIINTQPDSVQRTINEKFNSIKNELEFKGLDASVKDIAEDYSKMFGGYGNTIITDDNGNILYSINSGYVSEKTKFLVIVDPWEANGYGSNIAYLIDSKNNVKYSVQLDIAMNMNKIKGLSAGNPLAGMLYSETQEAFDISADREITNSDGTKSIISPDSNIIMNYEYIASKGFNLYFLYDSERQYNNYYLFVRSLNTLRQWLMIGVLVTFFFSIGVLAVYIRRKKRNEV